MIDAFHKLLLVACLTLPCLVAVADSIPIVGDTTVHAEYDSVHRVVDEMAQFPGGMNALVTFLQKNVSYPAKARSRGEQGSIFVAFVVEKDGALTDVTVVKGVSEELDQEALRVVALFPAWVPGKQDGTVVRSRFVLPIKFKLEKAKKIKRSDWH